MGKEDFDKVETSGTPIGTNDSSPDGYSSGDQEKYEYRNKVVINQRGATVEINNSTDREELKPVSYTHLTLPTIYSV